MTIHTDVCLRDRLNYEKFVEEFKKIHPNHCTKCGGWGGWVLNNYPHEPDDLDLCCDCLSQYKCPWCMQETLSDEQPGFCRMCGWNEKKPDGLQMFFDDCGCDTIDPFSDKVDGLCRDLHAEHGCTTDEAIEALKLAGQHE